MSAMATSATSDKRWPDPAAVLAAVWPWARRQRWCPDAQPALIAWRSNGAQATLIAEAAGRLIQLPLSLSRDCDAIAALPGDVQLVDGARSAEYVDAWAAAATPCAAADATPLTQTAAIKPLGGEQSNSSVRRDGVMIKFFRSPVVGVNPDVSISEALWQNGFTNIPAPLATSQLETDEGTITTAFAARLVEDAADGFEWACAHADATSQLQELGTITRGMHTALQQAFPCPQVEVAAADRLRPQLTAVSKHLETALNAQLERIISKLESVTLSGPGQRIHGDYHLGQCLLAERWYVLDFEGEPLRPLAERTAPDRAERDVAGMLRSFAYAQAIGEHDDTWQQRARSTFLEGYGDYDPGALAFFELEKALYEVKYEAASRPDWIGIPLAGVRSAATALEAWLQSH